jgi:integrase
MRRGRGQPSGSVYRPTGRDGRPTRFWWLMYKFPGETRRRRECTSPRTEDETEAWRQLRERQAERGHAREQRLRVEDLVVDDLLDLYVLDCADQGVPIQVGRVEPWRTALGHVRALEVTRVQVETLCRRWKTRGLTWDKGQRLLSDGTRITWSARDKQRVRPISGANCNRIVSVLRRAYTLGKEKLHLETPLTFPHYDEGPRGEYITEDQCRAICASFQAKVGAAVKADVFRLAYLTGIRKGRLRNARKRHVLIVGDTWKLKWPKEETKNKRHAHEIVLVGEALEIVQRAWATRLPDSDFLFHIDGQPLGPMRSELERTCTLLDIPYGRSRGVVFHDTRHSAVTNLVASGTGEAAAMSITGHADPSVFKRYNVRRDAVQADALARQHAYLAAQRGTTPTVPSITKK